jgi:hypothetical protein
LLGRFSLSFREGGRARVVRDFEVLEFREEEQEME